MPFYAGLDWGGASHAVCIVDGTGGIVARLDVRHDASGLGEMTARLQRIAPPGARPIAIERPSGLIVDALLAAGHPVIPIHPNVVKACRPRYRAAGGKSDPADAFMLADILRTDGHRFRPLTAVSDAIKALRALVRGRADLIVQRLALANQLRSLLEGFWPGAATIFAAIDSPIALAFIGRYPTPDSASRLGEKRLASFMTQHAYSGRRSAADLVARLRAAPAGLARDAEIEAKGEVVRALVGVLERLIHAIAKLSSRIEQVVAQLPDGRIVMSFPRAGRINAGQILAELGDVRERFPCEEQLAAEAGVCPVTHASGKSRGVVFRWACNKNLRLALTCFADNSRHACPWAAAIYNKAVSADASTPTQCVSWPAPGYGSSGELGRTANPTTRQSTAVPHASPEPNHCFLVRLQGPFLRPGHKPQTRGAAAGVKDRQRQPATSPAQQRP
jgi:transposase